MGQVCAFLSCVFWSWVARKLFDDALAMILAISSPCVVWPIFWALGWLS